MANKKADAAPAKNKVVFSKAKVLTLNRYAGRRDALIQNFMKKGKVK